MSDFEVKRGDIFFADLSPVVGSEQGGVRPVLIIQNNIGNKFSPTVTSKISKPKMPTHIGLVAKEVGLEKDSVVLLEQLRTIDKQRLKDKVTHIDEKLMQRVNNALKISVGLASIHKK